MKEVVRSLEQAGVTNAWYMRGGLSLTDAMNLSPTQREMVSKLISDNLETTKKTGQPFF